MNKFVSDYLEIVLGQIKCRKIHKIISVEIEDHINELTKEYISEGMSEDEAVKRAVAQMGDPGDIGKQLQHTHCPKIEWSIIALAGAIIIFGLYIILSYANSFLMTVFFYKQLSFAAIGTVVLLICTFADYTKLEKYSLYLYFGVTLLMLFSIIFGGTISGEKYIFIFGHSIDPTLFAIPLLLIFYSGIVKRFCDGKFINMLKLMGLSSLPVLICLMQPSLSNALIIGAGFLAVLTFAICNKSFKGNRKMFLSALYGSMAGALALIVLDTMATSPYRWQRILVMVNPELDPTGAGYQNMILKKLLSSSKIIGSSDIFTSYKLPGGNSEFVFTYIVSRFGWLLGILLVLLLSLFIIRLFSASKKVSDRYGKYLCIGICCVFPLQVAANILMNLGFFPIAGISLPFISYGGGNFVCNMALIGLLLGVYRRKDIVLEETASTI